MLIANCCGCVLKWAPHVRLHFIHGFYICHRLFKLRIFASLVWAILSQLAKIYDHIIYQQQQHQQQQAQLKEWNEKRNANRFEYVLGRKYVHWISKNSILHVVPFSIEKFFFHSILTIQLIYFVLNNRIAERHATIFNGYWMRPPIGVFFEIGNFYCKIQNKKIQKVSTVSEKSVAL